jgi:multicomponent K+:H+ antiporter subunit A
MIFPYCFRELVMMYIEKTGKNARQGIKVKIYYRLPCFGILLYITSSLYKEVKITRFGICMKSIWLIFPLVVCFSSATITAAFGLSKINRSISITTLSWLAAIAPFSAFLLIASQMEQLSLGQPIIHEFPWLPTIGLNAVLFLDGLSALFALLITGIGTLVVIYTGYYFKGDATAWRFLVYTLLFMTSMVGVVLAGDIITLFLFWEGTSITSFLLIGYKYKDPEAQRGAFKALFITAGGGIALLAGLVMISVVSGSYDFPGILASGEILRESPLYPVMFGLLAVGAFTKSAQAPAHVWLPDAMTAPTPASAYLHSATMVKAGIYLMARMNPALGFTDLWFWTLSLVGLATMLTGAYLGLKQNDLKALLAYSTVSQLGVLMMLIGQDTTIAFKALVIGVVAHALYKSALFLIAGIVDHETGTRDLQRLGGIGRVMPFTMVIAGVAALSMAGLPPLFGFLAKETLLASATHPGARPIIDYVFPALAVVGGALILAQSGLFFVNTFLGKSRDKSIHAHEPPFGMLIAPAIPAMLSLILGGLPEIKIVALALSNAAQAAYGAPVPVSLALWAGLNVPLVLSGIAIFAGSTIFFFRKPVRRFLFNFHERFTLNVLYAWSLRLIDIGAYAVTRVQNGKLRFYLATMMIGLGGLIIYFNAWPNLTITVRANLGQITFTDELVFLRLFALVLVIVTAAASVVLRRDLAAILALGVSGFFVAVLMVLEPAPDVALVQVVVDILLTIILVLLLARLPRPQRVRASEFTFFQTRPGIIRDGLIAIGSGAVVTVLVFSMLTARPRESIVTPYYEQHAKEFTGATDIVGAVLLDFRAFDTLMEIAVFGMAGIGVYTLLHYASRKAGDKEHAVSLGEGSQLMTYGIGGMRTSPFVRMLARVILPLTMVVSLTHIIHGHDQPGDGFTAGVMVSLAVGFWYVVFGYYETKIRLHWLHSSHLIGLGLLIAVVSGAISIMTTGTFMGHVDFFAQQQLPLPAGFQLSTSLLFEVAIFLTVLGSATLVIDSVGRPRDDDRESLQHVEEISILEKRGLVTRGEPEITQRK